LGAKNAGMEMLVEKRKAALLRQPVYYFSTGWFIISYSLNHSIL
jgi:hypothetical protein